jgi:hypothetical protein
VLHTPVAQHFCFVTGVSAQLTFSVKDLDTTVTRSDTNTYNRIRQIMETKKITKKIFSLLTRNPNTKSTSANHTSSVDNQFNPYEGKTINNIEVIVLPPFGYDVKKFDSVQEMKWLIKTGNKAHVNTRTWVVKNSLLFKKGQKINPLIIAETESFIRHIEYINDVHIQIDSTPHNGANIRVIAQDNWSIGAYIRNLSTETDIEIFDRNLTGLGNNFGIRGIFNTKLNRKFGGGLEYRYPNILKTFINIHASYLDNIVSTSQTFSIERPLQKNLNLFGQISHTINETNLSQTVWDSISPTCNEEFSTSLGYAFNPAKNDNTFVIAARFLYRNPLYRKVAVPDNPDNYQHIKNLMTIVQLSLFRQRHFRMRMVNSFGKLENLAYGYNVSTQFGYSEWTQFSKRGFYSSFKISANKQSQYGSIYFEGALSSFIYKHRPFEGVLKLKLNMFSSLYRIGNQNYRHFLDINYTKRLDYIPGFRNYNLTSNEMGSLKFRHDKILTANEKLMFNTEGNIFSSLNVMGFRFLFYAFADFGWVADYDKTLLNVNNIYWGAGLGIRIRNDLLVFRTIELKIGYYPKMNQRGFDSFMNFVTSVPNVSPNFMPKYPEEIAL